MGFDLATAREFAPEAGPKRGFDLSTAKPAGGPDKSVPDSNPVGPNGQPIVSRETSPDTGFDPNAAVQAGVSMASAVPAAFAGNVTALVNALRPSNFGTQEGAARATQAGAKVQEAMTYQPPTEKGREYVGNVGHAFEGSKLSGMGPLAFPAAATAAQTAKPAAQGARPLLARAMAKDIPDELPRPPVGETSGRARYASGGSAATPDELLRRQRAESLDVPVKLTKGMAVTGDERFGLQRFERETAKDEKLGKDLRERYADINEAIPRNFDAWLEQTGSEAPTVTATGKSVDAALRAKSSKMKTDIEAAYNKARAAGEMEERVDVSPIIKFLAKNEAAAVNAGVITATEKTLAKLADKGGKISLNNLEEVRQMVGNVMDKDAPNMKFGAKIKDLMDSATEGKGGEKFKQARDMYSKYAQQFKDHAVVSKLLDTNPGTKDRAVAFEDVFKHSILSGSLDDVRAIRRTLQTEGDLGKQAWKDLQGETIKHMQEEMTKNVGRDIRQNPIVNAKSLGNIVKDMDKDGKLDFIFGKRGAQKIRDIYEVALDSYSVPQGAVNTSGTASVLLAALGEIATGNFSAGTAKAITQIKKVIETNKTKKRIQESLADPSGLPPPP